MSNPRIQRTYEDSSGKRVKASRQAMAAVETILGQHKRDAVEPVRVVWEGERVPDGEIELEQGGAWDRRDMLPHGYHTLDGETLLIHAPRKAYAPREKTWGIFLPLYAVPRHGGDLGDLERYMAWVRELGGNVVATLPLLAAFDDEPSPYSPVSRLFWNERYLDIDALPEFTGSRDLHELASRFVPDEGFERFATLARDYARFRGDERYHLYVQYRMSQQMERLSERGLYLDFPLGVNAGGYDVARYGHVFAKGAAVGAPPDSFFTRGQNWGFPPFHPEGLRVDRYRYFRAAISHHARHAGMLRLDHVMGLHRLYWIPDGFDAADGVYVRYDDEELYAIVVLESVRNRCAIVGEDLGTVPQYVPKAMERHGLRRMYVVQYEAKPQAPALSDPPAAAVASINTHDMPTFAAFWSGKDIADRVEQGLLDDDGAKEERETRAKIRQAMARQVGEGDPLASVLRFLARSDAEVVLVNLEDLWGETEPQNVPGLPERSWKQRFRLSFEEARGDTRVARLLETVSEARPLLSLRSGQ
jgi:4-alpha-glucanotransferase